MELELEPASQLVVFVAGIWVVSKTMLEAGTFVNQLREAVVTGRKDNNALTLRHRRVMRFDWMLTMAAAVLFPILCSAFLFAIALAGTGALPKLVLAGVAAIPALGAALFAACGVADWRLMQAELDAVARKEQFEPEAPG